jgi:hypothetical protein
MGWELPQRGGPYYTRSRKVGGRVIREYVGGGVAGELAADRDAQERRQRAMLRERAEHAFARERDRHRATDALLDALDAGCRELMRIELGRAGYHQHERGEWRRRRGERKTPQET